MPSSVSPDLFLPLSSPEGAGSVRSVGAGRLSDDTPPPRAPLGTKWADYVITGVRYAPGGNSLLQLEVRQDSGDAMGPEALWTRERVLQAIAQGTTFVTAYLRGRSFSSGVCVGVVSVDRQPFLRADGKRIAADNIDGFRQVKRLR